MQTSEIFSEIAANVEAVQADLEALALDLHAHPELAYEEVRSVGQVIAPLRQAGFEIDDKVPDLPTAFRATWSFHGEDEANDPAVHSAAERRHVLFMAEYDALPGLGHACGHNLIASASVGAAIALKDWMLATGTTGDVTVLGTPAEERGGGKQDLIERGYFEGATCALMFHPYPRTVISKDMMAIQEVVVEYFGRAAHAAMAPETGINALDAMIQLFVGVGLVRQQLPDDVRMHGIITKGGEAPNIIPEHTEARFYLRTLDAAFSRELRDRFEGIVAGAADAAGCNYKTHTRGNAFAPMKHNETLRGLVAEALDAMGEPYEAGPSREEIASTDAGNVSRLMPTAHPYIAIGEDAITCHRKEFEVVSGGPRGLEGMVKAAKILATVGARVLTDPDARRQMWEDHGAR